MKKFLEHTIIKSRLIRDFVSVIQIDLNHWFRFLMQAKMLLKKKLEIKLLRQRK